ncbi:acyl-CoA thioesterase II [Paraglaciecola aquimarina]|uniref:Acyl-CoA thioesterase II n=1 Tax=Paraglaciecola aquimarina TaxID=1235557 RepID=A0ABU3SYT4_9ALTE|nr:acyl-CoA thioesterase II [Paraglaciecola aquimarina]MDU0355180.1 acyl-CoA thioesterase II [Paraglaciecola aquimarina]
MSDIKLVNLLTLEKRQENIFTGQSWDLGFRALFGGQVLGQALAAARLTVDEDRVAHSFHSYFLLPGDANQDVSFDVEKVRDGKSFSARRVKAIQNGKTLFYMTGSFQKAEQGLQHQLGQMPDVPSADSLTSDISYFEKIKEELPKRLQKAIAYHKPIDTRTVQAIDPVHPDKQTAKRYIWMKSQEQLGGNLSLNQEMLAYASDYHFLATCLQPHGISVRDKNLQIATIDHSMWFHHPFNFDDWLLYCVESPFAGGARGLVRGQFFNTEGTLVASTMQEGLIRLKDES